MNFRGCFQFADVSAIGQGTKETMNLQRNSQQVMPPEVSSLARVWQTVRRYPSWSTTQVVTGLHVRLGC